MRNAKLSSRCYSRYLIQTRSNQDKTQDRRTVLLSSKAEGYGVFSKKHRTDLCLSLCRCDPVRRIQEDTGKTKGPPCVFSVSISPETAGRYSKQLAQAASAMIGEDRGTVLLSSKAEGYCIFSNKRQDCSAFPYAAVLR